MDPVTQLRLAQHARGEFRSTSQRHDASVCKFTAGSAAARIVCVSLLVQLDLAPYDERLRGVARHISRCRGRGQPPARALHGSRSQGVARSLAANSDLAPKNAACAIRVILYFQSYMIL